jgi:hypothetical protein
MPVKKIDGLSSVHEIEESIKKETPKEKPPKKKWVRITLLLLLGLAIILEGINLKNSQVFQSLAGNGTINGLVVNSRLTPVPADIYVLGSELSAKTNDLGQFNLSNVPAGKVTLIIAYQGMGKEFLVKMNGGETISIGQVVVEETQIPPAGQP